GVRDGVGADGDRRRPARAAARPPGIARPAPGAAAGAGRPGAGPGAAAHAAPAAVAAGGGRVAARAPGGAVSRAGPGGDRAAALRTDLAAHRVLAVPGDAAESAGLVRWLVTQAACLHAPGDLRIAAALAGDEGWGWLKWLPHTAPAGIHSARRLLASGDDA